MDRSSRRQFLTEATLAGTAAITGCLGIGKSPIERAKEHVKALSKYRDVSIALSEGYRTAATYVQTSDGIMGTPFVNPEVKTLKPEKPQVLLYDLTEEGSYELLGVKWFRSVHEVDEAPSLFGKGFSGPQKGEVALIPKHYGLTAWLFRENPEGLFDPYNTAVEPAPLVSSVKSVRENLRPYLTGHAATKHGYVNTEKCVSPDEFYGVPFIDPKQVTSGGTSRKRPPILLYRVTPQWSYQLLGAEWYVPASEKDTPPTMFGFDFHELMAGHSPKTKQPDHYGLHAWLFRTNPRGMFAPFNPHLVC